MSLRILSLLFISLCSQYPQKLSGQIKQFAEFWEYIGIAVEEPGYTIWGTSPIIGEDGNVHLFVARWPAELKVDPGWRSHSEIAHYVGPSPEGPFTFSDISLQGSEEETWDKFGAHNPAIHKVGEKYVLLYIGNNNPHMPPHPANQKIGMAVSGSLYGPWAKVNKDGLILSTSEDPTNWNHQASNGVNNPALLQHPNGRYYLYFKSQGALMGLATSQKIEGPYVQMPAPITSNTRTIEDGYAFFYEGKICLLTTDNHGIIEKGGGLLWKSEDGIIFNEVEQGFYPAVRYLGKKKLRHATKHYGGKIIKFERPQVLMINDMPAYMYAPSGHHFFGKESTASYVLKFNHD
ncbi:MAG: glycoside hydrolase family protein [Bacteroidales bacterium]|nr:glycoside hydrolase family protein [Bacteroidales bacterium]